MYSSHSSNETLSSNSYFIKCKTIYLISQEIWALYLISPSPFILHKIKLQAPSLGLQDVTGTHPHLSPPATSAPGCWTVTSSLDTAVASLLLFFHVSDPLFILWP